jgi:hypothetical protein
MRRGVGTWLLAIGLLLLTGFCLWTLAEPRQTRPAMVEVWVPPPDAAPPAPPPPPAASQAAALPTAPETAAPTPAAPAATPPHGNAASSPPAPPAARPPPRAPVLSDVPPLPPSKPKPIAAAPAAPAPPHAEPVLSPAELAAARRKVDAMAHRLAAPPAPPQEPADDGFDAVLRSVEAMKPQQLASAGEVDPPPPPSPAELVRRQLLPCWEQRAGPRVSGAPAVQIRLQLDGNGRVIRTETVDRDRLDDPVYRAIATSAVRAILECQPVKPPPGPLASWAVMTLTFVP